MNKEPKLTPEKAEKLQRKIWSELPAKKKKEIIRQIFELMHKLKKSKTYKSFKKE